MNYVVCKIISPLLARELQKIPNMARHESNLVVFDFYEESDIDRNMGNMLLSNSFYSKIINSDEFQRLKQVSFLGAIDYLSPETKSNRYIHSLDVAKLALFISKQRNYDEEVQDHLVVAALLHDIGHAPLSHSMEPSFFDEFGINHHVAGNRVIKEKEFSLKKILEDQVSIDTVIDLVEQNSEEEFSDIFNSKINIDTIDGIQKSLSFVNANLKYDKYSLARASFIDEGDVQVEKLDSFWKAKDFVYKKVITSGVGAIADHISREYFFDNVSRIDESYFFKKESSLLGGKKPIFKHFSNKVRKLKQLSFDFDSTHDLESINEINLDVIERCYKVNKSIDTNNIKNLDEFISKRYECSKWSTKKTIYYTLCIDPNKKQYDLL